MRAATILFTILVLLTSGCATTWRLQYHPSSEISVHGRLLDISAVNAVAQREGLEPNRIPSRTPGKLYMTEDLEDFVRNALYKEIRFIGVRTGEGDVRLRVIIEELRMVFDPADVHMKSDVSLVFEVIGAKGDVIMRKRCSSSGVSDSGTPNFTVINQNIRKCIEQAFSDADFKQIIK